jgi:hypothetical protein
MKRPVKPFVVEHKRRVRGGSGEPPSIWSDAMGQALRQMVRDRERDEKHLGDQDCDREQVADRPVEAAPACPRILEARSAVPEGTDPPRVPVVAIPKARRVRQARLDLAQDTDDFEYVEDGDFDAVSDATIARPSDIPVKAATVSKARMESRRAKRAAARKSLPLHKRWRWDLQF